MVFEYRDDKNELRAFNSSCTPLQNKILGNMLTSIKTVWRYKKLKGAFCEEKKNGTQPDDLERRVLPNLSELSPLDDPTNTKT